MRFAVGIVSLLVGVGVVVWLFSLTSIPVAKTGKQAQDQTRQMAGYDSQTGGPATDALTLAEHPRGGRMAGVVVTAITPGSDIEKMYGLQVNDIVTKAGDLPLSDPTITPDAGTAKDFILKAFQESRPLEVTRGGQTLTLPVPPGTAPPAGSGASAPSAQPPAQAADAPAPPPADNRGALERQLDLIKPPAAE